MLECTFICKNHALGRQTSHPLFVFRK
jgi:hypothetical protein